jgi:hypothetical protein
MTTDNGQQTTDYGQRTKDKGSHTTAKTLMKKTYITPKAEVTEMENNSPLCISGRNVGISSQAATPTEVLIDTRNTSSEGLIDFDNLW